MVRIERDRQGAEWLPAQGVSNPPARQVMPNRIFAPQDVRPNYSKTPRQNRPKPPQVALNGRGKGQKPLLNQCPMCQFDFPEGFTEVSANAHVNSHFIQ